MRLGVQVALQSVDDRDMDLLDVVSEFSEVTSDGGASPTESGALAAADLDSIASAPGSPDRVPTPPLSAEALHDPPVAKPVAIPLVDGGADLGQVDRHGGHEIHDLEHAVALHVCVDGRRAGREVGSA